MTPSTSTPLSVTADRRLIRSRWHSQRFIVARVSAPMARTGRERPPVNLAFVLDRSGSMDGQKLRLAAQAVEEGIGRLQPTDRFSVVMYDHDIDVLVPGTLANQHARRDAVDRLRTVSARGQTDLGGGWLAGCEQVATALIADGVNRALLLTDGLANQGITDPDELGHHATELRARGVSTSTFGVGNDFDETLLQGMAQAGGGHFYDIASAAAIRDHISSEVGETLEVVARDVALQVTLPEGVRIESLGAFPAREVGGRTRIELGDLVSGQAVEVPMRLSFPLGRIGGTLHAVLGLVDRDDVLADATGRLAWEYADDPANDTQPRDREVDRVIARVFVARARREAVRLNRAGDYDGARKVLEATARRIKGYAGRDPELGAIVNDLLGEVDTFRQAMPERSRKVAYAQSSYTMQSRAPDGRARKSGS
jgi:Ca-activated chloride channel family protein